MKQESNWDLTFERVFCFFDEGKLVVLLNGFEKKTQKDTKEGNQKGSNPQRRVFQRKEEIMKNVETWSDIKDQVIGKVGTEKRDNLEREAESFKVD